MKFDRNGVNKVGYSMLVGVLALAYVSETHPNLGGLYFVVGFVLTYLAIFSIEIAQAIGVLRRELKLPSWTLRNS